MGRAGFPGSGSCYAVVCALFTSGDLPCQRASSFTGENGETGVLRERPLRS